MLSHAFNKRIPSGHNIDLFPNNVSGQQSDLKKNNPIVDFFKSVLKEFPYPSILKQGLFWQYVKIVTNSVVLSYPKTLALDNIASG